MTLRALFAADLARGSAEGTAKVAQSLFTAATTERNVTAMIFWMKAKAGWRERVDATHQFLGSDGMPVDTRRPIESFLLEWASDRAKDAGSG